MPKTCYTRLLTNREVLALFKSGARYSVDLVNGIVSNGRGPLHITLGGEPKRYRFVRVYEGDGHRLIGVAAIVWMVGNNRPLPKGFEVHHRDRDPTNNAFGNLFALSKLDHDKLHRDDLIEEEIPF